MQRLSEDGQRFSNLKKHYITIFITTVLPKNKNPKTLNIVSSTGHNMKDSENLETHGLSGDTDLKTGVILSRAQEQIQKSLLNADFGSCLFGVFSREDNVKPLTASITTSWFGCRRI